MPQLARCLYVLSSILSSGALLASGAHAAAAPSSHVTAYPAAFFATAQPYSAFDMLTLLPGYRFDEGDEDVRGYAGSAGNVLIDGSRPASKHESLETILRRIPAAAVSRIELIRPGAPGIDMQGQALLANVVRLRAPRTRGAAELGTAFYERDLSAPRIAAEFSRSSGESLLELSAARYRSIDDEHGIGSRPRIDTEGRVIRDTDYTQDEGERVTELAGGYERRFGSGKLRMSASLRRERFRADILELRTFPDWRRERVLEFEDETVSELGMRYEHAFDDAMQLELVGLRREEQERGGERGEERSLGTDGGSAASSLVRADSDESESILRAVLRRSSDRWTIEGGIEGALNVLDSHSALQEDGIEIMLPSANVRVEERRGEAFALATWRLTPRWTLEGGSRFEVSELAQRGDSEVRKSFSFAKPRALLSYARTPQEQWRLLLERRVGQLDFDDFVSSTSLSSNQVTAGNPDLEPDRTWRIELAWERHFMGDGAFVLALRHEEITQLVDRVPIRGAGNLDGVGNIGDGDRDELELSLNLPLHIIGLPSALLRTSALWRHSRTIDPATGQFRPITEDVPREIVAHLTQDLPRWKTHWGIDVELATLAREFRSNEVRADGLGTMVSVFAEYEPAPSWNIRVYANNLTDRSAKRIRAIYDGVRGSAPLAYIETRSLRIGPYAGVSFRHSFER